MKKIFVILLLTVSLNGISQTQDSVVRVSDTIPTISVNDLNQVLTYYYDKNMITPKEYDLIRSFNGIVINFTEPRRKVKVKKK